MGVYITLSLSHFKQFSFYFLLMQLQRSLVFTQYLQLSGLRGRCRFLLWSSRSFGRGSRRLCWSCCSGWLSFGIISCRLKSLFFVENGAKDCLPFFQSNCTIIVLFKSIDKFLCLLLDGWRDHSTLLVLFNEVKNSSGINYALSMLVNLFELLRSELFGLITSLSIADNMSQITILLFIIGIFFGSLVLFGCSICSRSFSFLRLLLLFLLLLLFGSLFLFFLLLLGSLFLFFLLLFGSLFLFFLFLRSWLFSSCRSLGLWSLFVLRMEFSWITLFR